MKAKAKAQLTPIHYLQNEEFKNMYTYVTTGELTGQQKTDRAILLMADQYFIKNNILYRLKLPRKKAQETLLLDRVCVPKHFRAKILHLFHDCLGHFATQRTYLLISSRFYWKTMFADIHEYAQTCDLCLRSRRNYNLRTEPLNSLADGL